MSIDNIKSKYDYLCETTSDINEHLPTIYQYATDCESIIELGVRGCISSWALSYGLINNNKHKKKLLLNDISPCKIDELLLFTKNFIDIDYKWINDLELDITEWVDLVFIDTWHVYGQLKRELDKFSKITNKYIIMHDTEIDKTYGESLRLGWDIDSQSLETGIPKDEIMCGLDKAINEFLENNKNWIKIESYKNNNGLTIIKKIE